MASFPRLEKLWGRLCKYAFHFLLKNLAYWAVRELGIPGSEVGKRLGLSQSAISRAVQRGEQLVSEHRLSLINDRNA